jgi:hypothetical protein
MLGEKKTQHSKKVLRELVNRVYSTSHRRNASSPFHPQQPTSNHRELRQALETIVKANMTSLNNRPASGRTFVRVSFRGGRNLAASNMHSQLNSLPAMPATLWLGQQYEDQPHPGGGSA